MRDTNKNRQIEFIPINSRNLKSKSTHSRILFGYSKINSRKYKKREFIKIETIKN
jgi:hypothetical protein